MLVLDERPVRSRVAEERLGAEHDRQHAPQDGRAQVRGHPLVDARPPGEDLEAARGAHVHEDARVAGHRPGERRHHAEAGPLQGRRAAGRRGCGDRHRDDRHGHRARPAQAMPAPAGGPGDDLAQDGARNGGGGDDRQQHLVLEEPARAEGRGHEGAVAVAEVEAGGEERERRPPGRQRNRAERPPSPPDHEAGSDRQQDDAREVALGRRQLDVVEDARDRHPGQPLGQDRPPRPPPPGVRALDDLEGLRRVERHREPGVPPAFAGPLKAQVAPRCREGREPDHHRHEHRNAGRRGDPPKARPAQAADDDARRGVPDDEDADDDDRDEVRAGARAEQDPGHGGLPPAGAPAHHRDRDHRTADCDHAPEGLDPVGARVLDELGVQRERRRRREEERRHADRQGAQAERSGEREQRREEADAAEPDERPQRSQGTVGRDGGDAGLERVEDDLAHRRRDVQAPLEGRRRHAARAQDLEPVGPVAPRGLAAAQKRERLHPELLDRKRRESREAGRDDPPAGARVGDQRAQMGSQRAPAEGRRPQGDRDQRERDDERRSPDRAGDRQDGGREGDDGVAEPECEREGGLDAEQPRPEGGERRAGPRHEHDRHDDEEAREAHAVATRPRGRLGITGIGPFYHREPDGGAHGQRGNR